MGLITNNDSLIWPDGLVPYEFNTDDYPLGSPRRAIIQTAIDEINTETNVTLTPKIDSDTSWVKFQEHPNPRGCKATTGIQVGENLIECDLDLASSGNLMHELMHEFGFYHEHIRADRDDFVTIQWDKIQADKCDQFQRKINGVPLDVCGELYDPSIHELRTTDVGDYDYGSVMHYGETFFIKKDEDGNDIEGETITTINPAGVDIGQRNALSAGDKSALSLAYDTAAIYIRDNQEDDGSEPLPSGGISISPDIIHVQEELDDPQATLGSEEAMALSNLSERVEFGQPNFVYVRLQKNGTLDDTASVELYWSQPSTLPTPDIWLDNQIGEAMEVTMSPGEVKVVGPFIFDEVPETGHYCFVAIAGSRKNPRPDIETIVNSRDAFRQLVINKSNVAWKNFDVIDVIPGTEEDSDFLVNSFGGASEDIDLDLNMEELPNGVSAEVRILKRIVDGATMTNLTLDRKSQLYHYYTIDNLKQNCRVASMKLKSKESTWVRVKVKIPEDAPHGSYNIYARQVIDSIEYGRVTRAINLGEFPFIANRNSRELHKANCPWLPKMSNKNKIPYRKLENGLKHGFDGCHTCLTEHDHG